MFINLNLFLQKIIRHPTCSLFKITSRTFSAYDHSALLKLINKMPRPLDQHISEAQKQRKLLKEKGLKYVPGTINLQVLGAGSEGCPKSVYLFTDQSRYLFNCGEGTQRLSHEHKMRLSRLEHVFLTAANWDAMGGLPGISLTLQDVGVPKIMLHGPPGLDELFTATGRFVFMKDMKIEMAQCDRTTQFEDSVLTVKYVPIVRTESNNSMETDELTKYAEFLANTNDDSSDSVLVEADNTDYYAHEYPGKRMLIDNDIENLLKAPRKENSSSMIYICRLKPRPGILDLQKCVNSGVIPGPMLGLLKNGNDVKLEDGSIIYSKDVRTPDDPGPVFIVMGLPDIAFLDSLTAAQDFKIHQEHSEMNPDDRPVVIVHFSPDKVLKHEKYQAFMKSFSPSTNHLIVNDENSCSGSEAIHRTQHKLHLLDKNIFPIIKDHGIPQFDKLIHDCSKKIDIADIMNDKNEDAMVVDSNKDKVVQSEDVASVSSPVSVIDNNFINARTLTTFHLRPKKGLDKSSELMLNIDEYITESMNTEGFPESLEELHKTFDKPQKQREEFPNIVFFGTGSCIPNKTRNTSGIMVHVDNDTSILMDCGEGTYSQMCRFYGKENVGQVLCNLKVVYLSHLHADHHLGFIGVLQARRRALEQQSQRNSHQGNKAEDNRLLVLAPKQIMSWLVLYDRRFERILQDFRLIANQSLIKNMESTYSPLSNSILESIGLTDLETCTVRHCPNSFGVTLTTKQSKKITYSGDTMPSEFLIEIGKDSDILIHEATMEDDLINEARRKMHSTAGQAIMVGKKMNAQFTLLTHFSQRYARIPRLSPCYEKNATSIGIAFDFMQVTIDDLWKLPHFFKPLKILFVEHIEGLEFKAAKRAMKRLRGNSPSAKERFKPNYIDDVTGNSENDKNKKVAVEKTS